MDWVIAPITWRIEHQIFVNTYMHIHLYLSMYYTNVQIHTTHVHVMYIYVPMTHGVLNNVFAVMVVPECSRPVTMARSPPLSSHLSCCLFRSRDDVFRSRWRRSFSACSDGVGSCGTGPVAAPGPHLNHCAIELAVGGVEIGARGGAGRGAAEGTPPALLELKTGFPRRTVTSTRPSVISVAST